jgi:uncharacterized low-complexity protein
MKVSKTTLTLAMTAALGVSGAASADLSNPFGMQQLDSGYVQLAEAKAKDGKCGEGKCGDKEAATDTKAKDGKCGEGKCGDNKAEGADKVKEAKCGEGKCGTKSDNG